MTDPTPRPDDARARALARARRAAPPAAGAALDARASSYDRALALSRFYRLSPEVVAAQTPEAACAVVREIERALRAERARRGHWTYDLDRHIALLVALRAESRRAARLMRRD